MRTALITGAAQGIGEAAALRLAQDQVQRFLLIDRQADALEGVADALRGAGCEVETCLADLADAARLVDQVAHHLGGLGPVDILVNAAGSTARGGLDDTDIGTFDQIFAVNTRAPFFLMQTVTPMMRAGGAVINISSMLAHSSPPFLLSYAMSKAALVTLTKGSAHALKSRRIRVFAINLGWTLTPGERQVQANVHNMPPDWPDEIGARQPFGRLIEPQDPAALIAFLASDHAQMMTGAVIDFDQHVAGVIDKAPGDDA